MMRLFTGIVLAAAMAVAGPAESARDRQDRAALDKLAAEAAAAAAQKPDDAAAQFRAALAASYLAEVALELRDKGAAQRAGESGIRFAEKAIQLKPGDSENHRVMATLCGQVIPANVLAGLKYGKRAQDAVNKAIELNGKSATAWMARGVGNYYLPPALGGGAELALKDFRKAIELDAKNADAYLWLGLGLRKVNRNAEARTAFEKSLSLNPARVWAKQQLEKTPAQ